MRKYLHVLLLAVLAASTFVSIQPLQAQNSSPYWSLAGNSNATTSSKPGTTNAIPLRILTNNVERLRVDATGKLGIGTTAPSAPLDVRSTSNLLVRFNGGTQMYMGLYENSIQRGYFGSFAGAAADVDFGTNTANTTGSVHLAIKAVPKLTVNSAGNVGIGTTTPAYKLHVTGTVHGASSTGSGVYGITSYTNGHGVYGQSPYIGVYGTSGSYGVFGTATQIGVYGQGGTYGLSGTATTSGGWGLFTQGGIGAYGSGTTHGVYGISGTNYGVYGYTGGGGTNPEPYYSSGVYGYNASYGYGVGGYGYYGPGIMGYTVYGWAGYFHGSVYATGTYQGSDRKLKQNITNLNSAMGIISRLQPKEYEYRQDGNYKLMNLPQGKRYGLIAQDVEQVLPGLIKEAQFDTRIAQPHAKPEPGNVPAHTPTAAFEQIDFKAVNYTELLPIMVKGMQELSEKDKEIDELKTRIAKLEELVNKLTNGQPTGTLTSMGLSQNSPNPVKASTRISYSVPEGVSKAQLLLTDALGRTLKVINLGASGSVNVDASTLSSGVYNYSLVVDGKTVQTKKMNVVR